MNTTNMHIPSNKVRDIERYFHSELSDLYPKGEIDMFTAMLFEEYLGWSKAQLLLHREETVNQSDLLKFHWAVEDLKKHRPIQHIIGHTDFCECKIAVSEDVLIPRPETEEILLSVIDKVPPHARVLDLCTGSGCLAIALAKLRPEAQVFAIDISEKALDLAQKNASENAAAVTFMQCDLLQGEPAIPSPAFDLIISNPPYVKESERAEMEPNVLDYEPEIALFVPDDDPLLFYRAIAQYAATHLREGGLLVLEINEHLGEETCSLLRGLGFSTTLQKDFRDKDRSIIATKTTC